MMTSNLDFHILTSAVIEVADDGKTAKAVWYSPGIVSEGSAPNWMTAWIYELYACDFVKEVVSGSPGTGHFQRTS